MMRSFRKLSIALALLGVFLVPRLVSTQGYSFSAPSPVVAANAATGLQVNYSGGALVVGGASVTIVAGNVTATNTQANCQAPAYSACNFIYWPGSGTALNVTTAYGTAFAPGNVVVAYVTAAGGNITAVTPAGLNLPSNAVQTYGFTDGAYWVPPGACNTTVSGNSTGTQGLTVAGASNTAVVQAQTSATGNNTHTYICHLMPTQRITTGRGISITDATFFYSCVAICGTQVNVLASGTFNASIVFSTITLPVAGTSETASPVTPVRADSGTLVITPVVASFNVSTLTAGQFYSAKFAPATPIAISSDLTDLIGTFTLQMSPGLATTTNSPGVLIHYTQTN